MRMLRVALFTSLAAAGVCGCASAPVVQPYEVGNELPAFTLKDQFGESHQLDDEVEMVLFSRDMDGGGLIRDLLAEQGAELLEAKRALYIADISGMPGFIASTMAIPRMRDRPYPTLLDREGRVTGGFPSEEGEATILLLDARRLREVRRAADAAALRQAIE